MPNSNSKGATPTVVPYSFSSDLLSDMGYNEEPFEVGFLGIDKDPNIHEKEIQNNYSAAEQQASMLIEEANLAAAQILEKARIEAEMLAENAREDGYKNGFALGQREGKEIALKENKEMLEHEAVIFLQDLQGAMAELEKKKNELLNKYRDELCQLALTIAEKVIKISLKSSTEVITKMILSATEKSKNKEWARIHISNYDANLMVHGEVDLLNAVQQISQHVKVVIMENEQPGTCIIEFPDQIIDASVSTQLENIKELLHDNRAGGGL